MSDFQIPPNRPLGGPPPPPPLPNIWKEATDLGEKLSNEIAALLAKMGRDGGDALKKDETELEGKLQDLQNLLSEKPLSTLPASELSVAEHYVQAFQETFAVLKALKDFGMWDNELYKSALNDLANVMGWMNQVAEEHPSK